MRSYRSSLIALACLATPTLPHAQDAHDPWEGFNRNMFAVHESVDKTVV